MKKTHNDLTAILVLLFILVALILSEIFPPSISLAFYVFTIILTILIIVGIIIIGNNPTTIGLVTRWSERLWKEKDGKLVAVILTEGWWWLFLRKIMYDVILISMIKREHDSKPLSVMTPVDKVTLWVTTGFHFVPSEDNPINYLDLGSNQKDRDAFIIDWFEKIKDSEMRNWAMDPNNGPKNWEEFIADKDNTVKVLMSKITGTVINDDQMKQLLNGSAKIPVRHKGIDIKMFNITKIDPYGEVYDASIAFNREKKERDSEVYEIGTEMEKAGAMLEAMDKVTKELAVKGITVTKPDLEKRFHDLLKVKVQREGITKISVSALVDAIAGSLKSS